MIDKHEYEGEMLVKSPAMFEGYLNRPEATNDCFTEDGWFRTGDCAFSKYLMLINHSRNC